MERFDVIAASLPLSLLGRYHHHAGEQGTAERRTGWQPKARLSPNGGWALFARVYNFGSEGLPAYSLFNLMFLGSLYPKDGISAGISNLHLLVEWVVVGARDELSSEPELDKAYQAPN